MPGAVHRLLLLEWSGLLLLGGVVVPAGRVNALSMSWLAQCSTDGLRTVHDGLAATPRSLTSIE